MATPDSKPVRLRKTPSTRKAAKPKPTGSMLDTKVSAIIKADSQITSNALEIEDSYNQYYLADANVLQPEIPPEQYYGLTEQNNTLSQCITAMEVNIDGTGFEIVKSDGTDVEETDPNLIFLKDFFNEVSPAVSFVTMRRHLRRQSETAGYGCIEVIRNPKDQIVFLKTLESKSIRLMKLGGPVTTTKTLVRRGVEMSVKLQTRERRFVQYWAGTAPRTTYFKEFGASRDLDKLTGQWSKSGERFPAENRATEIIYTMIHRSKSSPYGVPRWLNQLPSVIGSRSAEELNLEYFEAGGIPPLLVFISGGAMAETARKQLEGLLAGKARDKLKGVVADIQSTSGTIDKGGGVRVDVEAFGSDRQQDSMFENYDMKCEKRVRSSFRLPPLFVGKAEDYSYSSVFASYTLAEAQIFAPERMEFDELINNTIMKDMTGGIYGIKSKPLKVADAETNLSALALAMNGGAITKGTLIDELNKVGSLILAPVPNVENEIAERDSGSSSADQVRNPNPDALAGGDPATGSGGTIEGTPDGSDDVVIAAKVDLSYLADIANLQVKYLMGELGKDESVTMVKMMKGLNAFEIDTVQLLTSNKLYASVDHDATGMAELCGHVMKADVGDETGSTEEHTHKLLENNITNTVNNHTHTWAENDTETGPADGEIDGHTHKLS